MGINFKGAGAIGRRTHKPNNSVPALSRRTIQMSDPLYAYLLDVGLREPEALTQLRADTGSLETAGYQISPEQGQLMALLVKTIDARLCLEVGTFTGYSALAVALALPPGGQVIACDANEDWTAMARKHWDAAGVSDKIELRLGLAADTLAALEAEYAPASFDFAFIDADKSG